MFRKYVALAVCAALIVAFIQVPVSYGRVHKYKKWYDKIRVYTGQETEGHDWNEVSIYSGDVKPGNHAFFLVFVPYLNIAVPILSSCGNDNTDVGKMRKGRIGVIGQAYDNKWYPRYDRRFD